MVFLIDDFESDTGATDTLIKFSSSIMFAGWGIGAVVFGSMADVHGRRPLMLFSTVSGSVAWSLMTLTPEFCFTSNDYCPVGMFWMYILKFIIGLALGCGGATKYALIGEWSPPRVKIWVTFAMMSLWSGTGAVLAGVSALMADVPWRTQILCLQGATLGFVTLAAVYTYESPSFLVLSNQQSKAQRNIAAAASVNGVQWKVRTLIVSTAGDKHCDAGALTLTEQVHELLRPSMLIPTCVLWLAWFTVVLCYYGLSFAASSFPGTVYVSSAVLASADIVGYAVSPSADYFGRKNLLAFCFALSGVALLLSAAVPEDARLPLSVIGKIGLACAFSLVYVFASENFPPRMRSLGLGTCFFFSRLGGLLSPLAAELPIVAVCTIFGSLSLASGVLCSFLQSSGKSDGAVEIQNQAKVVDVVASTEISQTRRSLRTRSSSSAYAMQSIG